MASITEQTKSLAGSIMSEEVPALRAAVSEAVSGNGSGRSAMQEIWGAIRTAWSKILESGLVASIMTQISALFSSFINRSTAEGAPLIDRSAPQGLIGSLARFVPEGVRANLPPAIAGMFDATTADAEAPAVPEAVAPVVASIEGKVDSVVTGGKS